MYTLKHLRLTFFLLLTSASVISATDLLEAYYQALKHDPTFHAAYAARLAAEEAYPQARAAFLPFISATADHIHNSRFIDRYDTSSSSTAFVNTGHFRFHNKNYLVSLRESLLNYANWKQLSLANESVKQAISQYHSELQNLIVRTTNAYLDVLQAEDTLRFTRAEKRANFRQLDQAQHRYKVGLDAITSVYNARASYDAVKAREIIAENAIHNMKEKLREITGAYIDHCAPMRSDLILKKPIPDIESHWVDTARKHNFTLQTAEHGVNASRYHVDAQFAKHFPTLDLSGQLSANRGGTAGFGGSYQRDKTITLELNLPIFEGGLTYSQTQQAKHEYQQALSNFERTRRQVLSQTRQSYNSVHAGIATVTAGRQAVKSAKSAVESTEEAFRVGTRTMVNVLDAQKDLYDAERALSVAEYDYIRALLNLKQSAGILSIFDLEIINTWLENDRTTPPQETPQSSSMPKAILPPITHNQIKTTPHKTIQTHHQTKEKIKHASNQTIRKKQLSKKIVSKRKMVAKKKHRSAKKPLSNS